MSHNLHQYPVGCFVSTNSTNNQPSSSSSSTMLNAELTPDLTSYENACQSNPELQFFDSTLQHRTTTLINNIKVSVDKLGDGMESMLHSADFVIKEEDVEGVVVVDEMKTTVSMFAKTIDDKGRLPLANLCVNDLLLDKSILFILSVAITKRN
ncbi:hypothetical protein HanOQP8_Chr16g0609081 [Helianthus annuus]|nr:hypothetical protein HanIR_Chr16g0802631 [Helianthus annuus]KAJ0640228.1 hypothetical protein HanLR1_Chr16g0612991 [Helianthus annuus]KAJ0644181.1 hypothetical protein HanOQP8_Chr16g0609081 [Helianthus annuus]KAJ0820437.1 hypothetical protein HanPSC8_Chr16g0708021 [Helianthus annuus]